MENPFNITDEKLQELLAGYTVWLESDPMQKQYPSDFRKQAEEIRKEFLDTNTSPACQMMSYLIKYLNIPGH